MKSKTSARALARSGQTRVPTLFFEQSPETLRGGVIEARSGPAAALPEAQLIYFVPELTAGVFAAAVRMRYASRPEPSTAGGHLQGVHDQIRAVVVSHRVADDLAGGQVQPAGEVEPALGCRQRGDVPDQFRAGHLGVEVAADQVRGRPRLLVRPRQRTALAAADALDAVLAHQAGDPLTVDAPSQTPQFGMDARDAIGLA